MKSILGWLYQFFSEIWVLDTEFRPQPGELLDPYCLVGREVRSGVTIRKWRDELGSHPPFDVSKRTLIVTWYGIAEMAFFAVLGWRMPVRFLDLYPEYRNIYNCRQTIVEQKEYQKGEARIGRNSLIGACTQYRINTIGIAEKQERREQIKRGPPFTSAEEQGFLDYCEKDVIATEQLFLAMLPQLDIPRGLYRSRFVQAAALVEANGIPIDGETFYKFRDGGWDRIKEKMIAEIDAPFGVYEGTVFRSELFERLLAKRKIAWSRYDNGKLILTDTEFRDMCRLHPELEPLRQLRNALSKMRLHEIAIGRDERNRFNPSPFGARTSRNTHSNSRSILGPHVWMRSFIKPKEGQAIAEIDYVSEEFGIGAKLSGDERMMAAYESGDPYWEFAKLAGLVPADATKETHKRERDICKACVLGVGYGMEARTLAYRIDKHILVARSLLRQHREIFRVFWEWSDTRVQNAMLTGFTYTKFGWRYHVTADANVRAIRNFAQQATGAEILRLATCLAVEARLRVIGMLHDSIWIESSLDQIDSDVEKMRGFMAQSSATVLDGFTLRTEAKVVRYPHRFSDPRGRPFFDLVMSLL
jgi:hypothetical protein